MTSIKTLILLLSMLRLADAIMLCVLRLADMMRRSTLNSLVFWDHVRTKIPYSTSSVYGSYNANAHIFISIDKLIIIQPIIKCKNTIKK